MRARFGVQGKHFDGVEADNVDGYTNPTGFPLTAADQLTYNAWLARTAHALGLSIALKNDLDQARQLEPHFDYALDEQCFQYSGVLEAASVRAAPQGRLRGRVPATDGPRSARRPTATASCRCARISIWTPSVGLLAMVADQLAERRAQPLRVVHRAVAGIDRASDRSLALGELVGVEAQTRGSYRATSTRTP